MQQRAEQTEAGPDDERSAQRLKDAEAEGVGGCSAAHVDGARLEHQVAQERNGAGRRDTVREDNAGWTFQNGDDLAVAERPVEARQADTGVAHVGAEVYDAEDVDGNKHRDIPKPCRYRWALCWRTARVLEDHRGAQVRRGERDQ